MAEIVVELESVFCNAGASGKGSCVFVIELRQCLPAGIGFSVVDITPIQLEQAAIKLQPMNARCTIRAGDANKMESVLPDGKKPYDVSYAFMLLHKIPDEMKY